MTRRFATALTVLSALGIFGATLTVAPLASAEPGTVTKYPRQASATRYVGDAFDTCAAPSLETMAAWSSSPYRAIGVYVGGPNRFCPQPNLTPDWVNTVTDQGWKLLPIYVGLQAPCSDRLATIPITASQAPAQGKAAAVEAIGSLTALGLQPGSMVYADMESYNPNVAACQRAVLDYLSAFTKELHRRGYLSGVYTNLGSGASHLAAAYQSKSYARPDALWLARWDGDRAMTGFTGIPATAWSMHQRAKQYLGDHLETYGDVTLRIDSNWIDAPVGTVAQLWLGTGRTHTRTAPRRSARSAGAIVAGTELPVICQTPGTSVHGTRVWNKLADGSYVSDAYVNTPSDTGFTRSVPRCYYPYQVTPVRGTTVRAGAGMGYSKRGTLNGGALAWTFCQKRANQKTGTTRVWDRVASGNYVTDYHVASASQRTYSPALPRC